MTNRAQNEARSHMGFLIGFPLFIVAPCAISGWLGSRVRWPILAFFITWVLTPILSAIITVLRVPILQAISPPNNDGTGAIMLPFLGIVTGLIAGIVSAVVVSRRNAYQSATPTPPLPSRNE